MRIANATITRNYVSNLEKNYSLKYKSEQKISSYRQFQQASEMPAQAASAMRVRKAIANLNNYQDNLTTADNIYANAESSIMAISEIIQTTYEKCIEAANGTSSEVHTHSPSDMEILATGVEAYADEISRLMNLTVADRRIFGGVNNDEKAFNIVNGRTVTYNGVPVDQYSDPAMFPDAVSSYCDIGLGMTLGADGRIDEQSALKLTLNGVECTGCGKQPTTSFIDLDEIQDGVQYSFELTIGNQGDQLDKYNVTFTGGADANASRDAINAAIKDAVGSDKITVYEHGTIVNNLNGKQVKIKDTSENGAELKTENQGSAYSNNILQSILDAAEVIRRGDGKEIARYADHIYSLQTKVSLTLAEIGNTTKFIEFNQERITNNLETLTSRQNDLESTDFPSETTTWKMLGSIYSATLQMSGSVIPQSIFDFIS
ncbi:MAG: hypothetical protein NC394_01630 [Bacteroides sp.]|nr:hypothetical protein [Bacteroides sp.]